MAISSITLKIEVEEVIETIQSEEQNAHFSGTYTEVKNREKKTEKIIIICQ